MADNAPAVVPQSTQSVLGNIGEFDSQTNNISSYVVFYHSHTTDIGIMPICVVILYLYLIYIIVQFFYWLRFWRFLSHCWYGLHYKMRGERQGLSREEYERLSHY